MDGARYGRRISEEQVSELSKPSWARPRVAPLLSTQERRAMATKKSAVEQDALTPQLVSEQTKQALTAMTADNNIELVRDAAPALLDALQRMLWHYESALQHVRRFCLEQLPRGPSIALNPHPIDVARAAIKLAGADEPCCGKCAYWEFMNGVFQVCGMNAGYCRGPHTHFDVDQGDGNVAEFRTAPTFSCGDFRPKLTGWQTNDPIPTPEENHL